MDGFVVAAIDKEINEVFEPGDSGVSRRDAVQPHT
jgi:hypothetical protein